MTIIETTARVDEHGNVTVAVPERFRTSGQSIHVTLSTAEQADPMTQEEWVALLDRAAAASDWSTMVRPEQPPIRPSSDLR